jgi:hypothetical protein
LKIYRHIKFVEGCKALQVDIDAAKQWCGENSMELKIQKKHYFVRKAYSIHFNHYVKVVLILCSDCTKDLVLCKAVVSTWGSQNLRFRAFFSLLVVIGDKKSTRVSLDISPLFFTYFSKSVQILVIKYDEILQALAVEGDVLLPKLFPDPPAPAT